MAVIKYLLELLIIFNQKLCGASKLIKEIIRTTPPSHNPIIFIEFYLITKL